MAAADSSSDTQAGVREGRHHQGLSPWHVREASAPVPRVVLLLGPEAECCASGIDLNNMSPGIKSNTLCVT